VLLIGAGESDNDTIYGGAGDDAIYGALGDDIIDGHHITYRCLIHPIVYLRHYRHLDNHHQFHLFLSFVFLYMNYMDTQVMTTCMVRRVMMLSLVR
jgi:hypothetical protein